MRSVLFFAFLAVTTLSFSAPAPASAAGLQIPDIPPDAGSSMYRSLLGAKLLLSADDGLNPVVRLGERNLAWLDFINSFRPSDDKLSLTSKDTQRGIPIDKPNEYNEELISKEVSGLRSQIPQEMRSVLFENGEFTRAPPIEVSEYLQWSRLLDRIYQSALRWRMMAPWLDYLASRRHQDLRGWYFLERLEDRAVKLRSFSSLDGALQANIKEWLVGACYNSEESDEIGRCRSSVEGLVREGGDLEAYYQSKATRSQSIFRTYFTIPESAPRSEMRWEGASGERMVAPFRDPGRDDVRFFLKDNIEDEWRFGGWRLELPFVIDGNVAHVEFQPGVTPHVNRLGGDTIVMNANQPLTEYDAQWVIRHEYGHVLGFPDCYVEFYESERNVIVNYQFDIEDLMCSRRGHLQVRHVDELRRAYKR